MRALICGSRDWDKPAIIDTFVTGLHAMWPGLVIIQGDARGADTAAKNAAQRLHIPHQDYPAQWDVYGKSAGPLRNQEMLDDGQPQVVFGFSDDLIIPVTDGMPGGTVDMVRRASKAGLPTYAIGRVRCE